MLNLIKDNLRTLIDHSKELYRENNILFISSLFIPLIVPLFFYCPTSILRTIFYVSIPFLVALLFKNRQELKQLLSEDKILWRILAVFLVFMSASVLWSDNGETIRYFSKGKLFLFLGLTTVSTFYISYKYPTFSDKIKNFYIFGAVSSAIILIAVYYFVVRFSLENQRLEGMGRATNSVQAALLYALAIIAIVFGKFSNQSSTLKTYAIKTLLAAPPLGAMLLTQSRGPFLSLILTLTALFILQSKNRIKTIFLMVMGLIAVSIPSYFVLKQTQILDQVLNRKTTGRFEIWEQAIEQITAKPIFGNGLAITNRYHFTNEYGSVFEASHIHSLYLSTLFQGGIVGLALFLSLYFLFAKNYLELIANRSSPHVWIGGWVIMGAAFGITDFGGIIINLSTEWLVFWWPIGLVLGLVVRNRYRLRENSTLQ